jgi:hypothetical protein
MADHDGIRREVRALGRLGMVQTMVHLDLAER